MASNFHRLVEEINLLPTKEERDLAFILLSPKLINDLTMCHFELIGTKDELLKEVADLRPLLVQENEGPRRLGKYVERLLSVYFSNSKNHRLCAANLQLIEGKVTKGEIDFIVEDCNSRKFIHLEVALKFYLRESENVFIGPNGKDRLNAKLEKMIRHQLTLSTSFKHLLPVEFHKLKFSPRIFIKGGLFFPFDEWEMMQNKTPLLNGWWMKISRLNLHTHIPFTPIENRQDWIYPYYMLKPTVFTKHELTILQDKLKKTGSVMLVRFDHQGNIVDRGFIVQDQWPNVPKSLFF